MEGFHHEQTPTTPAVPEREPKAEVSLDSFAVQARLMKLWSQYRPELIAQWAAAHSEMIQTWEAEHNEDKVSRMIASQAWVDLMSAPFGAYVRSKEHAGETVGTDKGSLLKLLERIEGSEMMH